MHHRTIQELIAWDRWGILWIATLAAAVFLATQRKRINSYRLVVNALLPLILYPCVFLFSAWGQVEVHMAVALSRLLIHNGLNAVLLVSTAVAILPPKRRPRAHSANFPYFCTSASSVIAEGASYCMH